MPKIREWLNKLQGSVDTHEKRIAKLEEIVEWAIKIVFVALIGGAIGLLFATKK